MRSSLVVTVIGPDRTGLVESIAQVVAEHDGNWVESRMARLAGQFAGILRVDVPSERRAALADALRALELRGLQAIVASTDTDETPAAPAAGAAPLTFELIGHDRPGIVREVARVLAQHGVNVVDLETEVFSAPMSGELLFRARAEVTLPHDAQRADVRDAIEAVAASLAMDATFDD